MKISKKWLQTFFTDQLPEDMVLSQIITDHAFEIESIENIDNDTVFDIKVLPDRAHYALSHWGIAKEVSFITGMKLREDRIPRKVVVNSTVVPTVKVEASDFCRRYIACHIDIGDIPKTSDWTCAFLGAIGQRSINSIVDATNMNMFDIGQPLHAFDADKVKGTIVVRKALKGETIQLLDSSSGEGQTVELDGDYVIADDLGPLAIAGVKGGKRAGVDTNTTKIIIESANFEPYTIRKMANKYNLRSESSKRFENEITPELAILGMNNMRELILEMCPNAKLGPIVDVYNKKSVKNIFEISTDYIRQRLGSNIDDGKILGILSKMSIEVENKKGLLSLVIPHERLDLTCSQDIVEEIGRIYGYEHIKSLALPDFRSANIFASSAVVSSLIKNILINKGFSEVSLYTLVNKGEIETAYPIARDKAFLRKSLKEGMFNCLEKNSVNADLLGLDTIKIFEIGRAFYNNTDHIHLCIGFVHIKKIKGTSPIEQFILGDGKKSEFIEHLANVLNIPALHSKLKIEKTTKDKCVVFEIDIDSVINDFNSQSKINNYLDLLKQPISNNRYKKISNYPFIVRDVAVFVPKGINSEDVWKVIYEQLNASKATPLLVRHALFDQFIKGEMISYAFRMVFQSMDKTLTDDEVNIVVNQAYNSLKNQGWEVR